MAKVFLVAAALLSVAAPPAAMAQWNNQPFEFRRSFGGGGVGMSPAYRQAIIERKLFNVRPRNLVRDANGFLLEVVRGPSDQAFLRRQAAPFLATTPGLGFGFGGFVVGAPVSGGSYAPAFGVTSAAPVFLNWVSMIPVDGASGSWNGVGGGSYSSASAVIDSWIAQLPPSSAEP